VTTLTVGQGQQFATISSAIAASRDGDIIQVQAGTYTNDYASINTKITLQGVGGMVKMVSTGDIGNGKGILITNTDVTIDHFEFSGAQVADNNGAGIRYQGGALTVTNSYFHDNQNGLLANPSSTGTITIRNSEFDHNGEGSGSTHNIYVGDIAKLTIDSSFFHDAVIGHEIKSRAEETVITNNRIYDENGTSSYSIDLPNGGKATISGNVIQQGVNGDNPNIIAFGAEGGIHAGSSATISNNTVMNDMGRGAFVWDASGSPISVSGTKAWNVATMSSGSGVTVSGTTTLSSEPALDLSHPWSSTSSPPPSPPPPPPPPPSGGSTTTALSWTGGTGSETKSGGSGADTLNGASGNDNLTGFDGSDSLSGGAGLDTLNGNAGADSIYGGAGSDSLYGSTGADRFIFRSTSDSLSATRDRIRDFSQTQGDKIDLSGIDAKTGVAGDQAFTLVSTYTRHAGELMVVDDGDHWLVKGDVNGDGSSDFMLNVYSTTKPSGTDFIF